MIDKQKTIDFLKDLAWTWKVEINNFHSVVHFKDVLWTPDIYFCCGFDEATWTNKRCSDKDFTKKKYIPFDIDIRLTHYQATWEIMSPEQMDKVIKEILDKVDNTTGFNSYSYAVNSWNGLHLYYVWDEIQIDRDTYSKWVEYLQWMLNEIIAPYECDMAVKNIARIMRLPWTINHRHKEHWGKVLWDLWDYECEFVKYRPWTWSHMVSSLPELAEEQDRKVEEQKKIYEEARLSKKSQSDWEDINNIDVWELACRVWPGVSIWPTKWDITTLRETHKNMWAFILRSVNMVINWWSSLIKRKDVRSFTPYKLVYYEYANEDTKKTLEFFKTNYGVEPKKKENVKEEIEIPEYEYDSTSVAYKLADPVFDELGCMFKWDLATIVAEWNSWKTTFALDICRRNQAEWHKCYYINLEFNIRTTFQNRWQQMHWLGKIALTEITDEQREDMKQYVDKQLADLNYMCEENVKLDDLLKILIDLKANWYELVVIDTFSKIAWNMSDGSWGHQNECMSKLENLAQKTWLVILLLHHTNKNQKFSGSQKIYDLSKVFYVIKTVDWCPDERRYDCTKDKYWCSGKRLTARYNAWVYTNTTEPPF